MVDLVQGEEDTGVAYKLINVNTEGKSYGRLVPAGDRTELMARLPSNIQ